eukprot:9172215-Ditylum_brightwellii.AAC.1
MMMHPAWITQHIFDDHGRKQTIDDLLKGTTKDTWQMSTNNELGRLANGYKGTVKGSNTIAFIAKNSIPKGKK